MKAAKFIGSVFKKSTGKLETKSDSIRSSHIPLIGKETNPKQDDSIQNQARAYGSPGKESNQKSIVFSPQSALEILSREPSPIEWVWEKFIALGDLFIIAAFMKVGKSTFVYSLALSVARGDDCLGFPTRQGGVLILALEEHPREVELRLRKLGMREDDPIYVHSGPLPNTKEELAAIRSFIKENNIGLVLLDSLPFWWNVQSENDNAEVMKQTKPLLELARETGAAVGLIHHESKYGGRDDNGANKGDGKSIRGAGALLGNVDQAILFDRRHGGSSNQRVLKTIGRHSESPRELIIELEGNTSLSDQASPYHYLVLGSPEELTKTANIEKVKAVLSYEFQELKNIVQKAGVGEKPSREALEELLNATDSTVERTGKGVKGDPYKYRLKLSTEPSQASCPDLFPGFT
jgi:hypothetical protein